MRRRPTTASATRTPSAIEPVAQHGSSSRSSSASSGWASTTRVEHRARRRAASAERSMAATTAGVVERPSSPPAHARQCRRILEAMPRLRVAAAQLDLVVGDLDGNVGAHPRRLRAGRRGRLRPRRLPRARDHRLPARRPAAAPGVRRPGGRGAREGRGAHRAARPRSSASPRPARDLYNAAAVCAHGQGARASTASTCCPNYAVFDEQRYFAPSTVDGPLFVVGGRAGRRHDLRGRVEPDRPDHHAGRRRRRARRQHQRVAVLRGPAPRARDDARDARRRRVGAARST